MVTFNCDHSICIECFTIFYETKLKEGTDLDWSCFACKEPNPDDKENYANHMQLLTMLVLIILCLLLHECLKIF